MPRTTSELTRDATVRSAFRLDAKGQITWRTAGSSPYLGINDLLENASPGASARNGSQPGSTPGQVKVTALGTK